MKPHTHHRILAIAALLAVVALGATACGSGSSGSSSTPAAAGGSSGPGTMQGTLVDVALKDFSIDVSGGTTLAPGTYTFHVTNSGPSGHNLTIDGPGVSGQSTGTFGAGGTADLTVTLKNGTYDLFCSVPGHKAAGMDATVTVGTGGSGGSSSGGGGGGSSGGGSSASGGGWS